MAKDQPKSLGKQLQLGCKLKVKGMLKQKIKQDRAEYKAYSIELLGLPVVEETTQADISTAKPSKSKKTKAKVLICKKSNCWNKGGKEINKQLVSELENKNITEQVEIKTTGCLKKCKKAPNMVVLPDKEQYTRVKSKQVPVIVEKHLF
ncbi:MAG: (2Fe-2S) ferredoxin domain-containing protein [Pleurocapsa sp.]